MQIPFGTPIVRHAKLPLVLFMILLKSNTRAYLHNRQCSIYVLKKSMFDLGFRSRVKYKLQTHGLGSHSDRTRWNLMGFEIKIVMAFCHEVSFASKLTSRFVSCHDDKDKNFVTRYLLDIGISHHYACCSRWQ